MLDHFRHMGHTAVSQNQDSPGQDNLIVRTMQLGISSCNPTAAVLLGVGDLMKTQFPW